MVTGTHPIAGPHGLRQLTGFPDYFVYVPARCDGTARCPLVVYLYAERALPWQLEQAERYGMLVLAGGTHEIEVVDSALKQVLAQYPVDPDRIALAGFSGPGLRALELGYNNLDVFSRICVLSAPTGAFNADEQEGPRTPSAQFFVSEGIQEGWFGTSTHFQTVQALRQAGYTVKDVLGFRVHEHYPEDYALMWRWLHDSWALPAPVARMPGHGLGGDLLPHRLAMPMLVTSPRGLPEVPLTAAALRSVTMFWARLLRESDSIRHSAREAYLREFSVPIGRERVSVLMVDVAALAAHYPQVAAALKVAGVTAEQAVAYRAALLSAQSVIETIGKKALQVHGETLAKREPQDLWDLLHALGVAGSPEEAEALQAVGATRILRQNVAFMLAHGQELKALEATGMWTTP
jgi:predicted esterase